MTAARSPRLRELQRWFATVTASPHGVQPHARRMDRWVTRGPHLSAAERVQLYHDGYFARLVECLTDDYPALRYALGTDTFEEVTRAYISAQPSRSPSLNGYGRNFPAFCRARAEPWARFAADLARLEWSLVEVVHEPLVETLAPEGLASVPAERLMTARLVPIACLRVHRFDYPVNDFYQGFREERAPELPGAASTGTAVHRQGLSLWRTHLDPRGASLLEDLVSGARLADAVAALESRCAATGTQHDLPGLLPQWFGSWVKSGFFRRIELG